MKDLLLIFLVVIIFIFVFAGKNLVFEKNAVEFQNGDLILQSNKSGQGLAVQLATSSKYTHIGILIKEGKDWMVYEAVEPVRKISFSEFIKNGEGMKYSVIRLKNDSLIKQDSVVNKIKNFLINQIDKSYDWVFNWSDNEMYCSEYVFKAYQISGIKISNTRLLKDYKLSHPIVQAKLKERYGKNIPLNDTMVAPSDIFNDKRWKIIFDNY